MKYTENDIRPKRSSEGIDDLDYYRGYWMWLIDYGWCWSFPEALKRSTWYIPVPGHPLDLKPLSFPDYHPGDWGKYLVYVAKRDAWEVWTWKGTPKGWFPFVDYFIPYCIEPVSKNPT